MIDTHCHIHSSFYELDADEEVEKALKAGVTAMICPGTSLEDSKKAIEFVRKHESCYGAVGVHPHEAKEVPEDFKAHLLELAQYDKVVAIGECGLDYFYGHSPREKQIEVLRMHIEVALELDLALILHIRGSKEDPMDAFSDYQKLVDEYDFKRAVVHSFTSGREALNQVLSNSHEVGLNGIVTFMRDGEQLDVIKSIPLDRMVLETDAPFLTPVPKRGRINSPELLGYTAQFLSKHLGVDESELIQATSSTAKKLFRI